MRSLATTCLVLAVTLMLTPGTALADEPIEALRGSWRAEQLGDTTPPDGFLMYITFRDHENLIMNIVTDQGSEQTEIRYTATEQGAITFYPNPEDEDESESYNWTVGEDGKLRLVAVGEGITMVFSRYTPPAE